MPQHAAKIDPSHWLAEHGDVLWRYAMARVRDPQAAEEVLQETFLAALESSDSFRGHSSERTWLISILRHKIADRRRRQAREQRHRARRNDPPASMPDVVFDMRGQWRLKPGRWPRNAEALLEQPEFWHDFEHCMSLLPHGLAEAFVLRDVREQPAEGIAAGLGITLNNLWVRLHRARSLLRRCLERTWENRERRS